MSGNMLIACPRCHRLNRVPTAKLSEHPVCGSCKQPLFDGKPVELDQANFAAHVSKTELPVLVDFWAPWCGPCKTMAPVFAQAAGQLSPRVRLAKVNTEAQQGLAAQFGIRSIPTLVLFKNGREMDRLAGAMDLGNLMQWVRGRV